MTTDALANDALFDALADGQRRELLVHLQDIGEASVEELASTVDRHADARRRGTRDLAVRLHHVHLPKLADADLVEYDRSARRVEYVGGSAVRELLGTTVRETIPE